MLNETAVNNTLEDSPFTKPVYVAVSVGFATPSNLDLSSARIVSEALSTTNEFVTLAAK